MVESQAESQEFMDAISMSLEESEELEIYNCVLENLQRREHVNTELSESFITNFGNCGPDAVDSTSTLVTWLRVRS